MIAIIDYGLGNLHSVAKALEAVGAKTELTNSPEKISNAKGIVLPGVGAFSHGINNLKELGIIPTLKKAIVLGKPLLGICLGLQLLFTETEEYGIHKGLNIISGRVVKFTGSIKVPHIGWNQIKFKKHPATGETKMKIFEDIPSGSYFYFVHSYYVKPEDKDVITATTDYGIEFSSAIEKNNIFGLQFHPEKSSELGLKILENFNRYVS